MYSVCNRCGFTSNICDEDHINQLSKGILQSSRIIDMYNHLQICNTNDQFVKDQYDTNSKVKVEQQQTIPTIPNFIQLFIIRRIVVQYTSKHGMESLDRLSSILPKKNECNMARQILIPLVKFGIKTFMQHFYNEKKYCQLIEKIMNKIIFTRFEKEYGKITQYKIDNINCNNKYKCQRIIFNTSVIMHKIFRYLYFRDLIKCDLVCTHWLYHSWHTNAVLFVDLSQCINYTLNLKNDCNNNNARRPISIWQRLFKAHIIGCRLDSSINATPNKLSFVVNKLSAFKNIDTIWFEGNITQLCIMHAMLKQSGNKLKSLNGLTVSPRWHQDKFKPWENVLSIPLMNASSITIEDLYCYPIWTAKCNSLFFRSHITPDFLNHIVNFCDCSNVSLLDFENVYFGSIAMTDESLLVFENFANKFQSLSKFKIHCSEYQDMSIISILQCLKPIIDKNEGKIIIEHDPQLDHHNDQYFIEKLSESIGEHNLKLYEFGINFDLTTEHGYTPNINEWNSPIRDGVERLMNSFNGIINNSCLQRLKIRIGEYPQEPYSDCDSDLEQDEQGEVYGSNDEGIEQIKWLSTTVDYLSDNKNNGINKNLFKNLQVLEFRVFDHRNEHSILDKIIDLIEIVLNVVENVNENMCFIGYFEYEIDCIMQQRESWNLFLPKFQKLCQCIFALFLEKQRKMKITLTLKHEDDINLNDLQLKQLGECREKFDECWQNAAKSYQINPLISYRELKDSRVFYVTSMDN